MSKRNSEAPGNEAKRYRSSDYKATGVRYSVPVNSPLPSSARTIAPRTAGAVRYSVQVDPSSLSSTSIVTPMATAASIESSSIPRASTSKHPLGRGSLTTWNTLEPSPEPSTSTPSDCTEDLGTKEEPLKSSKPKRSHGQSTMLAALLPHLPTMQKHILATFTHWQLGQLCECKTALASFRCLECFNSPMWCRTCIVQQHQYTPFHHIEQWNGKCFERDSMDTDRILRLHLGRDGEGCITQHCPNKPPGPPQYHEFTICNHNGFHIRLIEFCHCVRTDEQRWEQLLAVRLFPGTIQQPKTAFTFDVMREFQIHSLASKKICLRLCQGTVTDIASFSWRSVSGEPSHCSAEHDKLMELISMSIIAAPILLLSDARHVQRWGLT
ncbi:CxC2 domain-containing protein [Mycena venus]|uniref:CxC2 domain-containing protein n=1 Tax=Mycena venus TaxID=2733690 RepID=A0A8H6Z5Y1_9AGAR|nr:CxC2 domain-containing protein [Mycena venus]